MEKWFWKIRNLYILQTKRLLPQRLKGWSEVWLGCIWSELLRLAEKSSLNCFVFMIRDSSIAGFIKTSNFCSSVESESFLSLSGCYFRGLFQLWAYVVIVVAVKENFLPKRQQFVLRTASQVFISPEGRRRDAGTGEACARERASVWSWVLARCRGQLWARSLPRKVTTEKQLDWQNTIIWVVLIWFLLKWVLSFSPFASHKMAN